MLGTEIWAAAYESQFKIVKIFNPASKDKKLTISLFSRTQVDKKVPLIGRDTWFKA